MDYKVLEENAARLVTNIFESPHRDQYPYHNLVHTKSVAEHAKEIGRFCKLDERDMCVVTLAAWFHDVGQLDGDMEGHEQRGVLIMNNFLAGTGADDELVQLAGKAIIATRYFFQPQTLTEKIVCDADAYHFGTLYFRKTEFLMKKEMQARTGKTFPRWHEKSLQLLRDHVFYTEYCQLRLNQGKKENMEWLKSLIALQH